MGKVETLRQQAASLLEEAKRLESMPKENFEDDDVILFKRKFPHNRATYTYAAVRVHGSWYVTGKRTTGDSVDVIGTGPYSWETLLERFLSSHVTEIWCVLEWSEIEIEMPS